MGRPAKNKPVIVDQYIYPWEQDVSKRRELMDQYKALELEGWNKQEIANKMQLELAEVDAIKRHRKLAIQEKYQEQSEVVIS